MTITRRSRVSEPWNTRILPKDIALPVSAFSLENSNCNRFTDIQLLIPPEIDGTNS